MKTTESGGPRGYDVAKKIKGRKRHIVTDTQGHLIALHVHPANIQDRDGAVDLLQIAAKNYPYLLHFFADSAYAGQYLRNALAGLGAWYFEIIRRSDDIKGFAVLPRRWVVERTFAWLARCHRLAKDFEATIRSAVAWISSPTSASSRADWQGLHDNALRFESDSLSKKRIAPDKFDGAKNRPGA